MPTSTLPGERVPVSIATKDPLEVAAPASDLAEARRAIVEDLRRDRRLLRTLYVMQLYPLLALAVVLAVVAVAGLVISLDHLRSGADPSDLEKLAAVLATGGTSLLIVGTVRFLGWFERRSRARTAEERRLTRVRNLVRLAEDRGELRDALDEYAAGSIRPPSLPILEP